MTIRILRRPEVEKLVGLSRSTIYSRLEQGTFPQPVPLGGRLVGWLEQDIQDWIKARIEEAGGA
ncbi:helix-turn-helix transcriptional regulator [Neptuniibacter pectenicola]|uniref:helix-turn-helix transcriptional regulator n=1 Tax=Neptuniibacter pectenicola TaxID=1806669 RepID=UPI000835E245|nr:AlpA family transcriptional regulator [Neptuniibacter pectenicola]